MQGRMDSHGLLAEHRLSDGTWSPSPFLELCSSLLSAVRTQAVCMCAEVTQKWEGIGSALAHAVRSGSAAGTVWAVWALSRVSVLLLLERRVDKGVLNDHFLPSSEHSVLSFLPGDDNDPYLEMGLLGRSLEGRQIMYCLLYRQ